MSYFSYNHELISVMLNNSVRSLIVAHALTQHCLAQEWWWELARIRTNDLQVEAPAIDMIMSFEPVSGEMCDDSKDIIC